MEILLQRPDIATNHLTTEFKDYLRATFDKIESSMHKDVA